MSNTHSIKTGQPSDIVPIEVEIQLGGRACHLKKWSLRSDAWLQEKFEMDLFELSKTGKINLIAQVIYYQLKEKEFFLGEQVEEIDEEGRKVSRFLTGWEKMRDSILPEEGEQLGKALWRCYGVSQSVLDQSEKKIQKKSQAKQTK